MLVRVAHVNMHVYVHRALIPRPAASTTDISAENTLCTCQKHLQVPQFSVTQHWQAHLPAGLSQHAASARSGHTARQGSATYRVPACYLLTPCDFPNRAHLTQPLNLCVC